MSIDEPATNAHGSDKILDLDRQGAVEWLTLNRPDSVHTEKRPPACRDESPIRRR